jgi:hypothetical protein
LTIYENVTSFLQTHTQLLNEFVAHYGNRVILYGRETWSLTLREEHKVKLFENRVLRRIFGPKRDEVTGEWRKLHSEELHILYSSPDIIRQIKSRRMRWAEHVARMGEECVQGFDGKARRKETTWKATA